MPKLKFFPHCTEYPPQDWCYPPLYWTTSTVLKVSPTCTAVIPHSTDVIPPHVLVLCPHCTEQPPQYWCYPPQYWWYPPLYWTTASNPPQYWCYPPMYWTTSTVLNRRDMGGYGFHLHEIHDTRSWSTRTHVKLRHAKLEPITKMQKTDIIRGWINVTGKSRGGGGWGALPRQSDRYARRIF